VHWGETRPLREIVANVAALWAYHAGEINLIHAVGRGEAWEYGEHVEENHISTIGHSVRRAWITDEQVERFESEMREAAMANHSADRTGLSKPSRAADNALFVTDGSGKRTLGHLGVFSLRV
jgi:hypothetical protein